MESATTVEFAAAARTLTARGASPGLVGPSFRCPPRLVGIDRSIRRRPDGRRRVDPAQGGRPVAAP
jgi:hypothetical protein